MSKLAKFAGWNTDSAKHLIGRTQFGYSLSQLNIAASYTIDEYVDNILLKDLDTPSPPASWVNNDPFPDASEVHTIHLTELTNWWIKLMMDDARVFQEKMVLFWHNHFVSEANKVFHAERMYWQNSLFRAYAFGNIKELTKEITIDSAMLWYLDGMANIKDAPNENFARELLELFTIGIGNYSQQDIKQAALSLTGWTISYDKLKPKFNANTFYNGNKQFLGQSGNFNHNDIIEIIFSHPETAKFLCKKICNEFLEPHPDADVVAELSQIFVDNNYTLKPVLSTLFKSNYFYSQEIRGSKIKTPFEFLLGLLKTLEISIPNIDYIRVFSESLEQTLFNPPDVRGWQGHKKWINSTTFPLRNNFSDSLFTGLDLLFTGYPHHMKLDIIAFIKKTSDYNNVNSFVDNLTYFFFAVPLSKERKNYLKEVLLEGSPEYAWSVDTPEAEFRIINMFKKMFRLPEYQLN